jgi:hypothetical protein
VVFGASAVVLVTAMLLGLAGYVLTAWRLRTVFEIDALLRATRRRVPPASQEVAWR